MSKNLVATPVAAEYIDFKPNTLEGWRTKGVGPRYYKLGRLVKYSLDDLDAYIAGHTRKSTSQQAA